MFCPTFICVNKYILLLFLSCAGIGASIGSLLQVLGYDKKQVSSLGVDMVMYLGELAANTILDTEENNINTEMEEYSARVDRKNVFSMIKVTLLFYY